MRILNRRKDLGARSLAATSSNEEKYHVLLTGSTGNLGTYILNELLKLPQIYKVTCLNRSLDAESKQQAAIQTRGLDTLLDSRVDFIRSTFHEENLGLDTHTYTTLTNTVDLVLHNAWPVDFNRTFMSFKDSVDGVDRFIKFCTAAQPCKPPIKLLFISSVGVTSNWGSAAPTSRSKIPEVELTDWKVARTGYGQSKLFCERLLAHAAESLALPVAIVRVGQLSGPVNYGLHGKWPEQEWVPSLIRSSITLGMLPESLGPASNIDWVPADVSVQIICEIAMNLLSSVSADLSKAHKKHSDKAHFYHVVNPQTTKWADLVPAMKRHMPESVATGAFVEWVDLLRQSVESAKGFQGVDEGLNPAGKLLDFFDTLQDRAVRFPKASTSEQETKKTVKVSDTLAALPAVGPKWMELWMRQWNWSNRPQES